MADVSFLERVGKIRKSLRITILVVTVLILAGAFFFLVFKPKTQEIQTLRTDIANLESRIQTARIRAKKLKKLEEKERQVEAQFREALQLLPNEKEIPSLLRGITQLGSDSNLEFRLFQPKRERPEEFYYKLPVAVEVSGSYHDVAVFFDKVGRMKRIVNILDVSMKPVKERDTTLITKCDAVTYRFREKQDEEGESGKGKK